MTLADVFRAVRAGWLRIGLAVALGVALGGLVAAILPKTYVATATVALRWIGPQPGVAELANVRYLAREAQTVAILVERSDVLDRAAATLGPAVTGTSITRMVEATIPLDSQLVKVTAEGASRDDAAALAMAVAESVVSASAGGAAAPNVDTLLAVAARAPASPAAPRLQLHMAAGAFGGLVAGVVWTLFRSRRTSGGGGGFNPQPHPAESRGLWVPYLAWALMISAVIPWRTGSFYEGGADPVVVAKAGLSVLALGLTAMRAKRQPTMLPVPAVPVLLVLLYLGVTVIGGIANEATGQSLVVAVRVAILAATVCLLASVHPARELTRTLVHVLALITILGAATGVGSASGRLSGGFPPLHPNLLALLSSIVAIWILAKVLTARDARWDLLALAGFVTVVILTGSRTGMAGLALAGAVMVLRMTALRMRTVVVVALAIPPLTYVALGTNLLQTIFTRGGEEDVSNLSNRTIAWEAAFGMERDAWQRWFGQGLAQKEIRVPGQWWDTQMLDSSWVSALVQGGYLGLAITALLVIWSINRTLFSPRVGGPLWFGLLVYLTTGGFLESGLFDGTVQFLTLFVAMLAAFGARHHRPRLVEPAGRPMAEATSPGSGSAMEAC